MSVNSIKFSVVIPLYNKGLHVERAIRSVLEQDFPPTEIIVVDDASTDGGLDIVRRFKGVRILRRSQRGPGGYAARNLGIEAASCEWIAFLDADDRWRNDHLSTLAAAIAGNNGQVGCAFTRPSFVTAGSATPYPISRSLLKRTTPLDLRGFVAAWLDAKTCPMWTGAIAIRRSILLASGMFPAGTATRGGDKDAWLRVMTLTRGVFVPRVTAEFHQDTVNRVTRSLDHSVQPIVCKSIVRLLETAQPATRRLLKRLNNMEVVFYARYAAGAGAPFNRHSFKALRGTAVRSAAALLTYATAGRIRRLQKSHVAEDTEYNSKAVDELATVADGPSIAELAPGPLSDRPRVTDMPRRWIGVAAGGVQETAEDLPMRLSA